MATLPPLASWPVTPERRLIKVQSLYTVANQKGGIKNCGSFMSCVNCFAQLTFGYSPLPLSGADPAQSDCASTVLLV